MPLKKRFNDKYAGSLRKRICCPNSVRLVSIPAAARVAGIPALCEAILSTRGAPVVVVVVIIIIVVVIVVIIVVVVVIIVVVVVVVVVPLDPVRNEI